MTETVSFNLINPEDANLYIKQFCDNDPNIETWTIAALTKVIRQESSLVTEVTEIPEDAPDWLLKKWATGGPWHRFTPKKGTGFPHIITEIAEWIEYAHRCQEPWTRELNPKGIPFKLLTFSSLTEIREERTKDISRISARLRREARERLPHDIEGDTRTVMTFNDGFRIVRLVSERALDRESAFLEHCVGDGDYDEGLFTSLSFYYSLRDENDIPCATMSIESKKHYIQQIAGRRNVFPEKYFDYLATFCHEFELDLVWYMRIANEHYTIPDTYEFSLYPSLWKKSRKSSLPALTFEKGESIELHDDMQLSYLKIDDIGSLREFPKKLKISGPAFFLGSPLPEKAPINLQVSEGITTSTDVFDNVEAFLEKNYGPDGLRRPPAKIALTFGRKT